MKLFKFLIICFIFLLTNVLEVQAENNTEEIDIAASPTKILFDTTNMKPGDTNTRVLTIQNKGKQDFNYLSSAKFLNGSDKLYSALQLKISDSKGILFDGRLSDFKKLSPRFLSSMGEEELTFHVVFPYELGNEYQGLATEVEFNFYVEGTLGGVIPVDNRLPATATDMFNLLLGGVALVGGGTVLLLYQKRRKRDIKPN